MTNELLIPYGLLQFVYERACLNEGTQVVFKFPNSYGASIINHKYSYGYDQGLFEMAVVIFKDDNWDLLPDGEVIGYLTNDECINYLFEIKESNNGNV